MNSHTTRRPRIGLLYRTGLAVEILDGDGNVTGYTDRLDGSRLWLPDADFTPLAEIPEPRMDEPRETWATVAAQIITQCPPDVFVRTHDGLWRRCATGSVGPVPYAWDDFINPRPTTPIERQTGIVGGEDDPKPRMDEPGWGTVVGQLGQGWSPRVFYRRSDGKWERLDAGARPSGSIFAWDDLINPRPTTPAERETGIVGGEDQ